MGRAQLDFSVIWKNAYPAYLAAMLLMAAWIVATPLLAMSGNPDASTGYEAGKYICHQKISRTYCLFSEPIYGIGDCTPQKGTFRNDERSEICADGKGDVRKDCLGLQGYGYKFPVSSRDMAIYIGMLFGAMAFPLLRKIESAEVPHWAWLALALVPLAIDGTTQMLMWRESTNLIRAATGLLAGVAMSFYLIPIFNRIVRSDAASHGEGEKIADGWKTLGIFVFLSAVAYGIMVLLMHPGI